MSPLWATLACIYPQSNFKWLALISPRDYHRKATIATFHHVKSLFTPYPESFGVSFSSSKLEINDNQENI
jgi:hypothetical protein